MGIHITRQERISEQIGNLPMGGEPILLNMYPKELKRFKSKYRSCSFDILRTQEGENHKIHLVRISL